jgi:hypothetical protein
LEIFFEWQEYFWSLHFHLCLDLFLFSAQAELSVELRVLADIAKQLFIMQLSISAFSVQEFHVLRA